jgi:ribosomal protein S27AE
MNAICPRCGTVMLAAQEAKRFKCATCRTRYCRECQSWKERGQRYCLACGLNFSTPPGAIHSSVMQSAGWAMLLVLLMSFIYRTWSPWYALVYSLAALGIYFAVYLVRFQRRTSLTWAARREAFVVLRQGIIWGSLVYFVIRLRENDGMIVLAIGAALATALGLFIINRLNLRVLDELRANRAAWKAVLSMKAMDALFMRFPDGS